jgi:hypothetical protein
MNTQDGAKKRAKRDGECALRSRSKEIVRSGKGREVRWVRGAGWLSAARWELEVVDVGRHGEERLEQPQGVGAWLTCPTLLQLEHHRSFSDDHQPTVRCMGTGERGGEGGESDGCEWAAAADWARRYHHSAREHSTNPPPLPTNHPPNPPHTSDEENAREFSFAPFFCTSTLTLASHAGGGRWVAWCGAGTRANARVDCCDLVDLRGELD